MIKPHGSDKLNPLYVSDDDKRSALLKEAESLASIVMSSAAANKAIRVNVDFETRVHQASGKYLLYLRLSKVYPLTREWASKTRDTGEMLSLKAFAAQLREEDYCVATGKALRFARAGTFKTVVLDIDLMIAQGLDAEGFDLRDGRGVDNDDEPGHLQEGGLL